MDGRSLVSPTSAPVRRAIIAVLVVAAVLIGFAAMHALALSSTSATVSVQAAPPQPGLADGPSASGPAGQLLSATVDSSKVDPGLAVLACDQVCRMNCLLIGMICAILALAALIAIRIVGPPVPIAGFMTLPRVLAIAAQRIVSPQAPSLYSLSIIRT